MKKTGKFILAGNWKMYLESVEEAKKAFTLISKRAQKAKKVSVVIAPPAPFVLALQGKSRKQAVVLAAQDVSDKPSGAHTGSVSAKEMASVGAAYALVGHSERRAAGDTNEITAKKTALALEAGLSVILCVGETARDEHARYLDAVRQQLLSALSGVDKKRVSSLVVAYEPVWAIGKSYDTALKPSDIHEMTIYIRKVASEVFGKKGLAIPVLYGGSVNFENAQAILKDASVDGLLVGRQSLDPEAFGNMISYANSL